MHRSCGQNGGGIKMRKGVGKWEGVSGDGAWRMGGGGGAMHKSVTSP